MNQTGHSYLFYGYLGQRAHKYGHWRHYSVQSELGAAEC